MPRALVCGAGGFIGGFLVKRLLDEGYEVRAVDLKAGPEWHQDGAEWGNRDFEQWSQMDLRDDVASKEACEGIDEVYNLAADMGGMGYIETHKYECMQSVLINTNLLNAAIAAGVKKYFFASSACVYPDYRQRGLPIDGPLAESDAYPAMPEDGYGWEKLFSERMCRHAFEDRGLEVRVGRYHNVYGPHGTWEGGREKAPAAICRKVAEAHLNFTSNIRIWGDGEQTRSFMYIDDCIEGTRKLMESTWIEPLNIGSSELVSVNELVNKIERIAKTPERFVALTRDYDLAAPQGVRGRNSDNTLIKRVLRWEPTTSLDDGLRATYAWVYEQVRAKLGQ